MLRKLSIILLLFIACELCADNKYQQFWSYTFEFGLNKFDGDFSQKYNDLIPTSASHFTFGVSAEKTLTPIWGLGAEFYYLPMSASSPSKSFNVTMFHFNPYASANMLNLFELQPSKWGLWATLGAGLAYYNSTLYKNGVKFDEIKNGLAFTVPVGALLEYNLTNSVTLGTKLQYRSHNKDNLEGSNKTAIDGGYNYKGVTNDFVSVGTFFIRLKLGTQNQLHIRDVSPYSRMNDAYNLAKLAMEKADSAERKAQYAQHGMDSLKLLVDSLNKIITDGPDSDCDGVQDSRDKEPNTPHGNSVDFYGRTLPCFEVRRTTETIIPINTPKVKFEQEITVPIIKIDLNSNGVDSDNDGVPDDRDKEPNTPANTPVDFWGHSLNKDTNGFGSVYFDFDKSDLNEEAHQTIKIVADRMKEDKTLRVEIRGYCDYKGSQSYNLRLSLQRAEKAKAELVKTYKINPMRIVVNGKGKLLGSETTAYLNRRCNFFFDKDVKH
jgi:outer membrane protein OmpA-like peptidoglycan-associated protein/opacity protein-like surface antigen